MTLPRDPELTCPRCSLKFQVMQIDQDDAPPPQESATVAEIRDAAENGILNNETTNKKLTRWANKLAAAEQRAVNAERDFDLRESAIRVHQARIAGLGIELSTAMETIHDADKDRVQKNKRIAELESKLQGAEKAIDDIQPIMLKLEQEALQSRQPAPSQEVDWGSVARAAYRAYDEADESRNDEFWWECAARASVAAYESQKGAANGD